MIELSRYFDVLFLEKDIIPSRLIVFTSDNIAAMTNNNPGGIYINNIAATQAAKDNLQSKLEKKSGDKGSRKGNTTAKQQARRDLEIYNATRIGWARALFGSKDDPRFIDTFPQLMQAFYNKAAKIFETNVDVLIAKATKYESVLGAQFKADLVDLFNAYTQADEEQRQSKSNVRTNIVTVAMAVEALALQLTDNVLLIARQNKGNADMANVYFNTALLYPHKMREIHNGRPKPASETDICPIKYEPEKLTIIHNNGATLLTFGIKLNGEKVGKTFTLEHGQKITKMFIDYFHNGTSLYVINQDENLKGLFRIIIRS